MFTSPPARSRAAPDRARAPRAPRIALVRQLGHDPAGDLLARGQPRGPAPTSGCAARQPPRPRGRSPSPTPSPRGTRGPGSRPGSRARGGRRPCARSRPPRPSRAAVDRAVEHAAPPPIPVPSVSSTACGRPARRPEPRLGQQRRVRVVVDDHRQPEPLAHHVPERHVRQRQVRRPARHAGRRSTSAGMPNPTASRPGGRADLLDRLDDDVERLRPVGPAPGPVDPVMDDQILVDHARRAASSRPRRRRSRACGGMAGRYTEVW